METPSEWTVRGHWEKASIEAAEFERAPFIPLTSARRVKYA